MILRSIYGIEFDMLIHYHFSKPNAQTKLREIPVSPNIHKLQMVTYISCYFRRKKGLESQKQFYIIEIFFLNYSYCLRVIDWEDGLILDLSVR